jgi:DNA mismatch endonuclease, patch repair protein
MADVFSKAKRSEVMARIRSRGNEATEIALAKLFRRHKITGWRRHFKLRVTGGKWQVTRKARAPVSSLVTRHLSLTVRPDFVFRQARLALFVDGCFWHGCPKHGTQPKGNRTFWKEKFTRNKSRDQLVNRALRRANWRVLRIWEHELAKIKMTATPHPGPLPDRGGEGAEARLLRRLWRAFGKRMLGREKTD